MGPVLGVQFAAAVKLIVPYQLVAFGGGVYGLRIALAGSLAHHEGGAGGTGLEVHEGLARLGGGVGFCRHHNGGLLAGGAALVERHPCLRGGGAPLMVGVDAHGGFAACGGQVYRFGAALYVVAHGRGVVVVTAAGSDGQRAEQGCGK